MSKQFSKVYRGLLEELLGPKVHTELNQRTDVKIAVLDPASFSLDLSDHRLPLPGNRKVFPRTAAAEVAWFLKGDRSVDFIRRYAPIWDKFVESDGSTVAGAYGYRWRTHFGRDQIGEAVKTLLDNPSDRRIYISAWDPAHDGLGKPSKNVPCPVGFTLSITGGKLNSTLLIRSSDVFVGLPYDVMGHALLMQAIRTSYNTCRVARDQIRLGTMQVSLAHPHMYECHFDMAAESLLLDPVVADVDMPAWGVNRISNFPDEYVTLMAGAAKGMAQPDYHCRPEVVQ